MRVWQLTGSGNERLPYMPIEIEGRACAWRFPGASMPRSSRLRSSVGFLGTGAAWRRRSSTAHETVVPTFARRDEDLEHGVCGMDVDRQRRCGLRQQRRSSRREAPDRRPWPEWPSTATPRSRMRPNQFDRRLEGPSGQRRSRRERRFGALRAPSVPREAQLHRRSVP